MFRCVSNVAVYVGILALCTSPSSSSAASSIAGTVRANVPVARNVLRLKGNVKGGDDDDKHTDPDAYIPQGSGKNSRSQIMTCAALERLYLRGGAPGEDTKTAGPKLQVVFVSAEIAPWSVTGGLGAVCDGLPRAMAKQGHRVMSIAPRYDQYYDAWDTEFTAEVPFGDSTTTVRFFHAFKKGVDRVFVDHPLFLEKVWGQTKQKLYGPKWGKDYEDNQLRFAMFCKAALIATQKLSLGGFPYGENVVFVANDWHAALLPMYLQVAREKGEGWANAKCSMLLHNLAFQGRFPSDPKAAERLHLPKKMIDLMRVTQPLKVGKQKKLTKGLKSGEEIPNPPVECLNFIMGGIKTCDSIITVSPGYAKEVAKSPEKGCELEDIIKAKGITGILNGVEDIVRPDHEELGLDVLFNATSLDKKAEVKAKMQKAQGFAVSPATPLFVFMGRFDAQKGVDILFEAVESVLKGGVDAQFVFMGSGIEELEEVAAELETKYPQNFKAVLSFKGQEKYKTYAASDFALMPSRYEPCGLVQMEGMRFGVLPIVAPTGGLADTVQDMKTGLVMKSELDMDDLIPRDVELVAAEIKRAVALYADQATTGKMRVAAMQAAKDFSWTKATKEYIDHFLKLGAKPR